MRWIAAAFLVGFCAAYALWGGGAATAASGLQHSRAPALAAPISASGPTAQTAVPPQTPGAVSALRCTPFSVEFGAVPLDEKRTAIVAVRNTAAFPVTILEIHPSCGCTYGKLEQTKIAPGKSIPLEVGFQALQGKRAGGLTLTLATDEAGHPRVVIPVDGHTREEFTATPAVLSFGKLQKHQTRTLETRILRAGGKPFKIERVVSRYKEVEFAWKPLDGASGYLLTATAHSERAGQFTEAAVVMVDHPSARTLSIPVILEVLPEIVCTPSYVRAEQRLDKTVETFQTTVKRQTPGRLEILSVADSTGLPILLTQERSGDSAVRLTIQFKGPYPARVPFGQFLVKTNTDTDPVPLPYRVDMPVPGKHPASAPAPVPTPAPMTVPAAEKKAQP